MRSDHAEALANRTVLIVGDVMLDRFVHGGVDRVSPEAPVPVLKVQAETSSLGGAGNVASNVAALKGKPVLVGAVGTDAAGSRIADLCVSTGIEARLARAGRYSTCVKTRFVCKGRQMVRVDSEQTTVDPETLATIEASARGALPGVDIMVLSDYAKGVVTPDSAQRYIAAAHSLDVPVIVDPKSVDLTAYRHADVITPNAPEAAAATGHDCSTDAGAARAAHAILEISEVGAVVITRGTHGMTLLAPKSGVRHPLHLPARAMQVYDVVGAGDTVVATVSLALAAGLDITAAVRLGGAAAGVAVGKAGTATVSPDELAYSIAGQEKSLLATRGQAASTVGRWHRSGLTVGFANGCFDLLHPGHVSLLSRAREQCDRLVVALNTDASVKRLKGAGRPIQDESSRAAVIAALRSVDLVTLFDEDTPLELINILRPDVVIKGDDYTAREVVGYDVVGQWGGRVSLIPIERGHSSTNTIARLQRATID